MRHTPVTGNNETSSLGLLMCKDLKESNKDSTFIREGPGQTQKLVFEIVFFLFFFGCCHVCVVEFGSPVLFAQHTLVLFLFFC